MAAGFSGIPGPEQTNRCSNVFCSAPTARSSRTLCFRFLSMGSTTLKEFADQWKEPGDVFSVLLILGGDVVQLALAALTGGTPLTPIAFSFGWVAYAISAVLSAVGDNRLMRCPPEIDIKVINLRSGYARDNRSWLLSRLVNTYSYWMPPEVKARTTNIAVTSKARTSGLPTTRLAADVHNPIITHPITSGTPAVPALCITVYKWREGAKQGVPTRDWVWWSGFAVTALQLGVSAIPLGWYDDWAILLATACGTLLCYASASLPQWRREKWHARLNRPDKLKNVALTLGNGSQHVIVILGAAGSLDLEDLASGRAPERLSTRVSTLTLAVCWLALLITCTGIRANTWYLLAVGGMGMLHNLVIAGAPRYPESLGLPIELVKTSTMDPVIFAQRKVMQTLMELEEAYTGYGKALLDEFFPGKLREWEDKWWKATDSAERRLLMQVKQ
jgi:hypothetical protein